MWRELKSVESLSIISEESKSKPVIIFKHSTRCSTSALALNRLERNWNKDEMNDLNPFLLDVIRYRDISNYIEASFQITHQSPQVLIIKNGICVYDQSHFGINYDELKKLCEDDIS